MPEFTIEQHIDAPVETVWGVLADFGSIQDWSAGVKASGLTSEGPVAEGSMRHCDFVPFGGVDERIERFEPNKRLTVDLFETSKMPISGAVANFNLNPNDSGTTLTLHYSYEPNLMGRMMKRTTEKQMRKGIGGLADNLVTESERIATRA